MKSSTKKFTEYRTPEKHSLAEFKEGCILVPLNNNMQIEKWRGDGAKVNRERLKDFIREGVVTHNPNATAKRQEKILDETITNLIESIKGFIAPQNPCVAVAYPLNTVWIIAFMTEIFTAKMKDGRDKEIVYGNSIVEGMDISKVGLKEIRELNYDPHLYAYTIMQRASEEKGLQDVYAKSEEELEKLKQLREQQHQE